MPFADYTELKASVQSWMNRGDSVATDKVPDFIRLGEERVYRRLRLSGMVQVSTLVILAAQNWVALPDRWLEFKRISTSDEKRIEYMAPDALYDYPDPAGIGSSYTIEGGRLIYGSTPDADLTLDVRFYQRPEYLSEAFPENWLLTASPSIFLQAAMVEFHTWAKNAQGVDLWGGLFDKTRGELEGADEAAMVSGGRLRARGSQMGTQR